MGKILRLTATLAFVSALVGLLLGAGNALTQEYIEASRDQERFRAMKSVLAADEFHLLEGRAEGSVLAVYEGRSGGEKKGCVFVVEVRGYGGMIEMMTGINVNGIVEGKWILKQQETPGLGSRAAEPPFREQFRGRKTVRFTLGEGGENPVQAISGATITSNAVVRGVNEAVALYRKFQDGASSPVTAEDPLSSAFKACLPADEYVPVTGYSVETPSNIEIKGVYEARSGGITAGYLFHVGSEGYYEIPIEFVVGIAEDGIVSGLKVIHEEETPGLGALVAEEEFQERFKGKKAEPLTLGMDGDSGQNGIESVSGASYSSGAVVSGVNEAIALFRQLRGMEEVSSSVSGDDKEPTVVSGGDNELNAAMKACLAADEYVPVTDFPAGLPGAAVQVKEVYEARSAGERIGFLFRVDSEGYYELPIDFVVGITEEGVVSGLKVIHEEETPGLGSLVAGDEFQNSFKGKNAEPLRLVTEGSAGDDGVYSVSGASFSSGAVVSGVNEAVSLFRKLRE